MDHIKMYHDTEVNNGLFRNEIGKCRISKCRVPSRQSRNGVISQRMLNENALNESQPFDGRFKEIIRQWFLNENHGYLLHPISPEFDDKQCSEIAAIHPDRNNRFVSDARLQHNNNNNNQKLKANVGHNNDTYLDTMDSIIEENDDEEKDVIDINTSNVNTKGIQIMVDAETPTDDDDNDIDIDSDDDKDEQYGMDDEKYDMNDENDDDESDESESGDNEDNGDMESDPSQQPQIFRFGHKYGYIKFIKEADGKIVKAKNYVGCKYENLKKELVDDVTKKFDINKWNALIAHAAAQSEKDYCKNLKAKKTKYGWNTAPNKSISVARIVAIELYCNYDDLQLRLCETYRKDVLDTKKQRQKHSSFAHWAKLLRSTGICFIN